MLSISYSRENIYDIKPDHICFCYDCPFGTNSYGIVAVYMQLLNVDVDNFPSLASDKRGSLLCLGTGIGR